MLAARDLPLLPVFVAVASAGSFTGAGRELHLAKSVVSQHIRTLEERCGVRLIERSTRRLHLTQIGVQVLDCANEMLSSVRALEQVIEGHHARPTGTLRVTLPLDPGLAAMVSPIAAALTAQHESLKVDLLFDDAIHDLVSEGLDVALRLGALASSSYVVQKLGIEDEIIVATNPRIVAFGPLEHPKQLGNAPWVAHSAIHPSSTWTFKSKRGQKAQISVDTRATTNTALAQRHLLLAGAGFGVMPRHMVADDLKSGRLEEVCPGWFHHRLWLHALLPTRQTPPRVSLFLKALEGAVKPGGFEV